jgi:hypothetical protein
MPVEAQHTGSADDGANECGNLSRLTLSVMQVCFARSVDAGLNASICATSGRTPRQNRKLSSTHFLCDYDIRSLMNDASVLHPVHPELLI